MPLVAPAAWALGLWLAVAVARRLGWPHDAVRIAANLLAAWLAEGAVPWPTDPIAPPDDDEESEYAALMTAADASAELVEVVARA